MPKALQEHIHPFRLARHGESLAGSVVPGRLPRLAQMLHQGHSRADFELKFGYDEGGQACVLGHVDATLAVLCQRCLEPMGIHVDRDVQIALVLGSAEAAAVDGRYDPLLVGDEPVSLSGLLEDELILGMPDFTRHASGECTMPPGADAVDDSADCGEAYRGDAAGESATDNPFLVLESLKHRKTS